MSSRYPTPVDLASENVGGAVLAANDDFFAAKENLVKAEEAIFLPDKFVSTGKWMDGWETRRRREPGHDWAIIRLGLRGAVREVVVDTSHFKGNYPEECVLEACDAVGQPDVDALLSPATTWTELVPRSRLNGDRKNRFTPTREEPVTHIRLRIFPDGGVARLRVYGDITPNWDRLDFSGELSDLAAVRNGGRVLDCSDMFFGSAQNLLMPGQPANMGEGWETRRRRDDGHDWAILSLGNAGRILRVLVDTMHFKGNAPGTCAIEVCEAANPSLEDLRDDATWSELLPRTKLQPHSRHFFQDELLPVGRATHVRFHIYPDGGVARLRLYGRSDRSQRLLVGLGKKNSLEVDALASELLECCHSQRWAKAVAASAPWSDVSWLMRSADRLWNALGEDDWREAFAAHPRIGERAAGWAKGEQAGVDGTRPEVMDELAAKNLAYEERFGHVFLICATGKSAEEMLESLRARLDNDAATELRNAAEEQRKITRLRLIKWLVGTA